MVMASLAWSSIAFGGEIHEAAQAGDLKKVSTLVELNTQLVQTKDDAEPAPSHPLPAGQYYPPELPPKTCPSTPYVNCMPRIPKQTQPMCSPEYLQWMEGHCPGVKVVY